MGDTIVAICTALAPSALGVVRLSGENAFDIADKMFKSSRKISDIEGYSALYGTVYDKDGDFDNVIALKFVAPHSFTGENTVEFSCHGGIYILRRLLKCAINCGARAAQGGEFTRRAFLNGKMDLTSAESIMDLVSANSKQSNDLALNAVEGVLFKQTVKIRQILLDCESALTAWVDFPEEGVPEVESGNLLQSLKKAHSMLKQVIDTAESGKFISSGIPTVIIGKPNVGKSTLMNLLSKDERSIVTDIPGTTRDVIEETVTVGNVTLLLADTAGIRETDDPIEKIGVDIVSKKIANASLILAVFDLSRPLDDNDFKILEYIKDKKSLIIINKSDLPAAFDKNSLTGEKVVISAKKGDSDLLSKTIEEICGLDNFDTGKPVIANIRQLTCAMNCFNALTDAINALEQSVPLDAVNICLDEALTALFEMTGEKTSEKIIDDVFSRFCVGK